MSDSQYEESYKIVQKDTKKGMNKQRHAVFLVGNPNTINRSILYKLIYKYKEIPMRALRIFHGIFQSE